MKVMIPLSLLMVLVLTGCAGKDSGKMGLNISKDSFGKTHDGTNVDIYTLTNGNGMTVKITNFGGIVTQILAPDRNGKMADVVLGFDTLDGYLGKFPYFGVIAGRYANRIAKGKFSIDGTEYSLATNNGPNHLHGGNVGFDKKVWKASKFRTADTVGVKLNYLSIDMEEGYPGNLSSTVTYELTGDNELKISYKATTDKATVINLTNHSYFNLAGQDSGDILGHIMSFNAANFTPVDDELITTGQIEPVKGTPWDFTTANTIGSRIAQIPGGYDHNYVLNSQDGTLAPAVTVHEPNTGRLMEMSTTEPGVQFYTGNFLDGSVKGKGTTYNKHNGFCLEAQHYPDSPNKPQWPSAVLRPGQTYTQTTVYKFSTR